MFIVPADKGRDTSTSGRMKDHQHSSSTMRKQSTVFQKPCTKLFLGDLSFHCTPEELVNEFSKYGFSTTVTVFRDDAGKPRGYGFAHFKSMILATKAREALQGKMNLHGRRIRIHNAGRFIEDQTPMNTLTSPINSVYVYFRTTLNIIFDEAYLATFFASHGTINDVCIKDVHEVGIWIMFFFFF